MTDFMVRYKRSLKAIENQGRGRPLPGEIWWIPMLDGIKDRPVLVLGCSGGTVTYRKCTSQPSCFRPRSIIEDTVCAGLDKDTYVDPEVRRISRSSLAHKLGELSEYDREKFGI